MIAIVNVSNNPSPFGVHEYELRINELVIARFQHDRQEGLAKCLRQAAKVVESAEVIEKIRLWNMDEK